MNLREKIVGDEGPQDGVQNMMGLGGKDPRTGQARLLEIAYRMAYTVDFLTLACLAQVVARIVYWNRRGWPGSVKPALI